MFRVLISDLETVFAAAFVPFPSPRPSVRNSGICLWTVSRPAQHPGCQSAAGGAETAPSGRLRSVSVSGGLYIVVLRSQGRGGGTEVLHSPRGPDPASFPSHRPDHVSFINYLHPVHDVML